MCGRYGAPRELEIHAGYLDIILPFGPRKHHGVEVPLKPVPVFARNRCGAFVVQEMRWGLIPSHFRGAVKDWRATTFHARLESVANTPAFAEAWRRKRRVIFPMDKFYENGRITVDRQGGTREVRYGFMPSEAVPLAVAGIYDHAVTRDGPVLSTAMLTREAGPRMAQYHDREPVVLSASQWAAWLSGEALNLVAPWPDDAFRATVAA